MSEVQRIRALVEGPDDASLLAAEVPGLLDRVELLERLLVETSGLVIAVTDICECYTLSNLEKLDNIDERRFAILNEAGLCTS